MPLPLVLLAAVRLLNCFYSLIPDCDEVFNYYEPLHLLVRGFGKQTWEYSPEYAIRSWCYLLPYALLVYPLAFISDLTTVIPSYVSFYAIRIIIASINVYAEHHLYLTLSQHCSQTIANWFLIFTVTSTGMSHSSVALLPSSLAMTCCTLATSNFIRYSASTHSTRNALLVTSWFAIGGLLGWPFALALAVPSVLYIMFDAFHLGPLQFKRYIAWSCAILAFYLVFIMEIDFWFYGYTVAVPFNIVLYNVIYANEESGPDIFGTEDVKYYITNLLLNFNVVAILAYLGIIIIPLFAVLKKNSAVARSLTFGVAAPIAIWSAVFFSQPHKEERFLYPIYTLISVSAASTTTIVLTTLKAITRYITRSNSISRIIHFLAVAVIAISIALVSILRTISLDANYNTPLDVYNHIPLTAEGSVCVGREWYRYPSSFFLPAHARLQFVESGFRGLLPGDFGETEGILSSIQTIPEGMNNKNEYDSSKVGPLSSCQYFVDLDQPVDSETGEVSFINDGVVKQGWELLYSGRFLDNDRSKGLGRLIYLPEWLQQKTNTKLVYHNYNLYKRADVDTPDLKQGSQ